MLVKYFKILLSFFMVTTLFFALAPGHWTPDWFVDHDKFSHFLVFVFLAFLLKYSFPKMTLLIHISLLICFAVMIELLQFSIFDRGFSLVDILYDLMGIALFLITFKGLERFNLKTNSKIEGFE